MAQNVHELQKQVIDWLCEKFQFDNYEHSFKDSWVRVGIWDGKLTISFDHRVEIQQQLLKHIPNEYKGTRQARTGIIVNLDTLYFDMDKEFKIQYPIVVKSIRTRDIKHTDNDNDIFYVYEWDLKMSNGITLQWSNQSKVMDICEMLLRTLTQRYFFCHLLTKYINQ